VWLREDDDHRLGLDSDSEPEAEIEYGGNCEETDSATADTSGSSSLPELSDSDNDPSLPLSLDPQLRALRIREGPYQPVFSKYKVTVHNKKARSFCSKWYDFHREWLEYSPMVDRMFCFVCRAFAHTVVGSVGRVDPAFTSSGTQTSHWKDTRKVLSRHQSSAIHKSAALYHKDFQTVMPINLQLDKVAASVCEACRVQDQQGRNHQILYRIIDIVVVLAKTGHPLRGHCERSESNNRGLFLETGACTKFILGSARDQVGATPPSKSCYNNHYNAKIN